MAESLCEELGKEILNLSEDIAKKKIDKAQYDKSYNAVILGVNQDFVDDVPEKEKTELISKHSIPETADNGKYYTFKINGVYYVNSGSVSLPKENSAHSYLLLDDTGLFLKDLDGTVIDSVLFTS